MDFRRPRAEVGRSVKRLFQQFRWKLIVVKWGLWQWARKICIMDTFWTQSQHDWLIIGKMQNVKKERSQGLSQGFWFEQLVKLPLIMMGKIEGKQVWIRISGALFFICLSCQALNGRSITLVTFNAERRSHLSLLELTSTPDLGLHFIPAAHMQALLNAYRVIDLQAQDPQNIILYQRKYNNEHTTMGYSRIFHTSHYLETVRMLKWLI